MKSIYATFACCAVLAASQLASAQPAPAPAGPRGGGRGGAPAPGTSTPTKDDWKPSPLNQPFQEYPQVNSEGFARFRVTAPNAQTVSASAGLGGAGGTPLK